MEMPVPPAHLKSIEFKRTFKIPDRKPEGSKSSGSYNHPWPLTDLLICWDMKWDQNQVQAADRLTIAVLYISALTYALFIWETVGAKLIANPHLASHAV